MGDLGAHFENYRAIEMCSGFELISLDVQEVKTHKSRCKVMTTRTSWIDFSPPQPSSNTRCIFLRGPLQTEGGAALWPAHQRPSIGLFPFPVLLPHSPSGSTWLASHINKPLLPKLLPLGLLLGNPTWAIVNWDNQGGRPWAGPWGFPFSHLVAWIFDLLWSPRLLITILLAPAIISKNFLIFSTFLTQWKANMFF